MIQKAITLFLFAVVPICLGGTGCMPDIGTDPVPQAMEFDPTAAPPRVPEPIFLVQEGGVGRIDLGLSGIDVPESCVELDDSGRAQCEFNQYLESLDGFPTLTPAKAPSSAPLDIDGASGNVLVLNATAGTVHDDVAVGFDSASNYLLIDRAAGWDVGALYVMAVKGYASGIKAADGSEIVASPVFHLLKEEESLTCGATKVEDITPDCKYWAVFSADPTAKPAESLLQLEAVRQGLVAMKAFEAAAQAGFDRGDTVVLWAFTTHTSPVAELDPTRGLQPTLTGPAEVTIGFKGDLDEATVVPWTLAKGGTVFLLDLTELAAGNIFGGLPTFTTKVESGKIVLTVAAPLAAGHSIGVLMTNAIKDKDERGLVPSPVAALLKSTGPLVDGEGKSLVSTVTNEQAAELEAGRAMLALLLDDEQFAGLTKLTRADLALVFAFDVPAGGDE